METPNFYSILDSNDFLSYSIPWPNKQFEEVPENAVPYTCKVKYFKPKFDRTNNEFYEGATDEEVCIELTPQLMERLQDKSCYLLIRAKAISMGKEGSIDYLKTQEDLYFFKYRVAMGDISNPTIEALIANEALEYGISNGLPEGMPIEDFKNVIITRYQTARDKYELFSYMIERCRTKIQTLIENCDWDKVNQAFDLVETLESEEQAAPLMNQIIAL